MRVAGIQQVRARGLAHWQDSGVRRTSRKVHVADEGCKTGLAVITVRKQVAIRFEHCFRLLFSVLQCGDKPMFHSLGACSVAATHISAFSFTNTAHTTPDTHSINFPQNRKSSKSPNSAGRHTSVQKGRFLNFEARRRLPAVLSVRSTSTAAAATQLVNIPPKARPQLSHRALCAIVPGQHSRQSPRLQVRAQGQPSVSRVPLSKPWPSMSFAAFEAETPRSCLVLKFWMICRRPSCRSVAPRPALRVRLRRQSCMQWNVSGARA